MKMFRPVAVPLITNDPYLSIWSFSDNLYEDVTRNWAGRKNGMNAGVMLDGKYYSLMGINYAESNRYRSPVDFIPQVCLDVKPLITEYKFKNEILEVTLEFITPLLPKQLNIMSRPISYIEYDIKICDGKEHDITFHFDISAECCVNSWKEEVVFGKTDYSIYCKNKVQNILKESGDDCFVNWGELHLVAEDTMLLDGTDKYYCKPIPREADIDKSYNAYNEQPLLAMKSKKLNDVVVVAYNFDKPLEYFGKQLDEYYLREFSSFEDMVKAGIAEYHQIKEMCQIFNEELIDEAGKIGYEYEKIVSLIFRQAMGAHKLSCDENGEILFISKECFSGGFAATLDVTYPSIPLFLKYNPELVKGMIRPIFKIAESDEWKHCFAPHDAGMYPLVNGLAYRVETNEHMPIEECGNAIIVTAAICDVEKNNDFALENQMLLKKWADYLIEYGYDPKEQLCTDDFAGSWPHNCNLSIKSIVAIAAYGKLFDDEYYTKKAREFAKKWEEETKLEIGTMLAFGSEDTWSIKYNMIWDKLLGLGLFKRETYKHEVEAYKNKMNRYGIPLDCREDYGKMDWMAWTTVMTDDKEYTDLVYKKIFDFISETPDRVPVTDYYYTTSGHMVNFQNRSVVGALLVNIM